MPQTTTEIAEPRTSEKGLDKTLGRNLVPVGNSTEVLLYEVLCKGCKTWPNSHVTVDTKKGIAKYVCPGCDEDHEIRLVRKGNNWEMPRTIRPTYQ